MTAPEKCCPNDHLKWGRNIPMDTIPLQYGGGWSCPGILLDGSDCGFEIGTARVAPVDEVADLRALIGEILDALEHSRMFGSRAWIANLAPWRRRAGLETGDDPA